MLQVKLVANLTGHTGSVYALESFPEKGNLFSAGGDNYIIRWDISNPDQGIVVAQTEGNIFSLLYLREQQMLVTGNMYGGMHWIDLASGVSRKDVLHHPGGVYRIIQDDAGVLSIGADGIITRWDLAGLRATESVKISHKALRSIVRHPINGNYYIGASDGRIYYLTPDLRLIDDFHAHQHSVFALAMSSDGKTLYSGGRDAMLNTWSEGSHSPSLSVAAHMGTVNALALSPDGQWLASAGRDKQIRFWDPESLNLLKVIDRIREKGHSHSVNTIRWLDNQHLVSGSDDRRVVEWELGGRE